jgi:hypothetical protein
VRRTQTRARSRSLDVVIEDGSGLASLFGTLFATDAKALDGRLDALAATVCGADPRTKDQRRADAMGALAHGADRLACLCGTDDCPAADIAPSSGVVVYVIAHQDTIDDTTDTGPLVDPMPDEPPTPDDSDSDSDGDADESGPRPATAPTAPTAPNVLPAAPRPDVDRSSWPRPRPPLQHPARGHDGRAISTGRGRPTSRAQRDRDHGPPSRAGLTPTVLHPIEEVGRLRPLPEPDVPLSRGTRSR